jgi:hypothetical protein
MFKVAIPSYGRSDVIACKTIATLARGNVNISDIFVFVVDSEYEAYKTALPGYQIICGEKGLIQQRHFIHNYFEKDTYILFLDDDIEKICKPITSKLKEEITDIPSLISLMKINMSAEKVTICGVYPCFNLKFALGNKEVTTNLKYLVGAMYLLKNTRDSDFNLNPSDYEFSSHEDKVRTILYYKKEKKTLRFNHIIIKTKYFAKGGLNFPDRIKKHGEQSELMVARFPEFLRVQKSKKFIDCKFKKIKV